MKAAPPATTGERRADLAPHSRIAGSSGCAGCAVRKASMSSRACSASVDGASIRSCRMCGATPISAALRVPSCLALTPSARRTCTNASVRMGSSDVCTVTKLTCHQHSEVLGKICYDGTMRGLRVLLMLLPLLVSARGLAENQRLDKAKQLFSDGRKAYEQG